MLMKRIIPCLDVRNGRVVKGVGFRNLREVGDPADLADRYQFDGADELVILDVSATMEERIASIEVVRSVRESLSIALTVGGGVRTVEDAERLLDAGADKISVNSAAVRRPDLIDELVSSFGSQCVIVAIDAIGRGDSEWEVVIDGGRSLTGGSVVQWAKTAVARGAGELLVTSHDRDGTGIGYDLDLIRSITRVVDTPVIASGGARTAADIESAFEAGATGSLIAGVLHDEATTIRNLRIELNALGRELRP